MAIGLWILAALIIMVSGLMLVITSANYRILLVACLVLGLTPLGFIDGPGIPIYLSELLLVALALGVFANCYRKLPDVRISGFLLVYCAFFGLQIVASMLRGEATIFDLVRDVRPVAFIGLLLMLVDILRQVSISRHVTEKFVAGTAMVLVLTDALFYAAGYIGVLSIGGISGEYYARTGLVRYSDLMTISLFGLANYMMFASEKATKAFFWLAICGIITVLSLNRIFAAGFLIAFSWWLSIVVRQWTKMPIASYVAGFSPIVMLVVVGILFARSQPDADEVISRVTEVFDFSLLVAALKYRFVEPALVGGYELSPYSFFFGEGIGLKFFVPWFEYRGLDPWHFSVDSLFALSFFKYGIIGLFVLGYSIRKLIWNRPWGLSNAWIWLYLLVHSGINVPGFLLFLLILTVLRDGSWLLVRGRSDVVPSGPVSAPA